MIRGLYRLRHFPTSPHEHIGAASLDLPAPAVATAIRAYRPATEKALETGLFLWTRFAGDSSGSPRGGLTAVSVEPLGAVARPGS